MTSSFRLSQPENELSSITEISIFSSHSNFSSILQFKNAELPIFISFIMLFSDVIPTYSNPVQPANANSSILFISSPIMTAFISVLFL